MNLSKVKNTPGMHHLGDHASGDWNPAVPAMQPPAHPAVSESPCLQNVQHQWGPPPLLSQLPHALGWQTIPTQMLCASESCSAGWMGHGSSHHWRLAASDAAMSPPGGIIYSDDTAHSSLSLWHTAGTHTLSLSPSLSLLARSQDKSSCNTHLIHVTQELLQLVWFLQAFAPCHGTLFQPVPACTDCLQTLCNPCSIIMVVGQ